MTLQDIPVDLLAAHPENINFMAAETLKKLRRHIERTGRYEPLTVRPHPWEEGKFQVINGHNRLRILRALNYQTAHCVVWNLDDDQTRLYLATLNRLSGSDVPSGGLRFWKTCWRPSTSTSYQPCSPTIGSR